MVMQCPKTLLQMWGEGGAISQSINPLTVGEKCTNGKPRENHITSNIILLKTLFCQKEHCI